MKRLLFFVVFAVVLVSVFSLEAKAGEAEEIEWCEASVEDLSFVERSGLGIDQVGNNEDCVCWSFEKNKAWLSGGIVPNNVVKAGEWFDQFCHDGLLRQKRTVEKLVSLACVEKEFVVESRDVFVDYCKECGEPLVVGEWMEKKCLNGKAVFERKVVGYVFSPLVSDCFARDFVEMRISDEPCGDSEDNGGTGEVVDEDSIEEGLKGNSFVFWLFGFGIFALLVVLILLLLLFRGKVKGFLRRLK